MSPQIHKVLRRMLSLSQPYLDDMVDAERHALIIQVLFNSVSSGTKDPMPGHPLHRRATDIRQFRVNALSLLVVDLIFLESLDNTVTIRVL